MDTYSPIKTDETSKTRNGPLKCNSRKLCIFQGEKVLKS